MDTDDLTEMAYQTIVLANYVTDVLKCELGVLCGRFKTEDEYLRGALEYLDELLDEPEEYLDSWGLLDDMDIPAFIAKLDKVRRHVERTMDTSYAKRGSAAF